MAGGTSNANSNLPMLLSGVKKTVGDKLMDKITSSKILLVGAGGIGCELLKNLALSGFTHVEVIDLDTIDVSNLNRQFLFRRQHVGMPKCTVACEAALAMLPIAMGKDTGTDGDTDGEIDGDGDGGKYKIKYLAHHGNVCDNSRFNVQYVSSFDLVLNALDNVTARRRVNRLCLAANVPLVEAGTTGYLGQVTVIDKASNVECYECQAKPTQKVYPICTIRSTPSMPVHTIVWAKELYKLLFHPKVEDSMLFEDQEGDEKSTYMDLVMKLRSKLADFKEGDSLITISQPTQDVLVALYNTEIQKQLNMDRYKTAQKIPTCVSVEMINKISRDNTIAPSKYSSYTQTQVLTKEECIHETVSCMQDAASILGSGGKLLQEFDKDDALAMRFVTCTSNLRSYIFGIEPIQSHYSAKGIAGNIIPAIATTNAIAAGLQVLQAFQILKKQIEGKKGELKEVCRYMYVLRNKTRKGYYIQPTMLPEPNPKCFVCRNAIINLSINTETWTLEMLLRRVIKKELGFMEPSLNIGSNIIYEEGEDIGKDEFAATVVKKLVDLPGGGVKHGTIVTIEDFTQDLEVEICVHHKSEWEKKEGEEVQEEEELFMITGDKPVAKEESVTATETKKDGDESNDDGGSDIEVVTSEESNGKSTESSKGKKRSLDDTVDVLILDEDEPQKKAKLN